jgi:hypothetical protein
MNYPGDRKIDLVLEKRTAGKDLSVRTACLLLRISCFPLLNHCQPNGLTIES